MIDQSSSLLDGLNPEQQQAVITIEGPVLVVAGPGSGKTRVLTHRIAYLLQEKRVLADHVLAVTFTNKAANEMRLRIERLIGAGAASGLWMGTFHSIGVRLLRQNPGILADRIGLLPNFVIYDDADQQSLAKEAIVAVGLDPKQVPPRRMLSRVSAAKSQLLDPQEFQATVESYEDEVVARVYREYHRLLRKSNAVDFDALLILPIRLFDAAPALLERYQERFQYILVDEYQDTNRVQYILISALADRFQNLFVVGDPDQSIYAWRQADIRNILGFQEDYPNATVVKLETNYRSTRHIVETADRLIRENTQRIERTLRTDNAEGDPVSLRELSDERHEARFVVDEIRRLMQRSGLRADQTAVMYRTTAQSRVLEESFRMSDIPYRIVGGLRFYERREVKDVIAILRVLHNPADELSLLRVIEHLPIGRGIGPKALDSVRAWAARQQTSMAEAFIALSPTVSGPEGPELTGTAKASGLRLGTVLSQLRELEHELTLTQLFDAIIDRTGYQAAFNHESEEEMERWTNVLELRNDLEDFDALAPGEALTAYLDQVQLVSDADTMKDGDVGQVTLITLHSAKGLEFPTAFIVGVEEGLLPISRAIEEEASNPAAIEEERRLFYVGITRAERLLYLTYTAGRSRYGRYESAVPSRFLANLPLESVRSSGNRAVPTPGLAARARGWQRSSGNSSQPTITHVPAPTWAAGSQAPAAPKINYVVGMHIFHPKFGEGAITEISDRRDDQELAIDFKRHGVKRLLASLAKLDVIE